MKETLGLGYPHLDQFHLETVLRGVFSARLRHQAMEVIVFVVQQVCQYRAVVLQQHNVLVELTIYGAGGVHEVEAHETEDQGVQCQEVYQPEHFRGVVCEHLELQVAIEDRS